MDTRTLSACTVRSLIDRDELVPYFQPIVSLAEARIYGYESLIRGPRGSALHLPDDLFAAAEAEACLAELEWHCCLVAMREFSRSKAPGKLLLNANAETILSVAVGNPGLLLDTARRFGLLPGRIILELTEHNRVAHLDALQTAMDAIRRSGVNLALDDFGDGHSSLRMWTELHPDLVKLDRHFVHGAHRRNGHFEVLKVFLYVAERFGGALVAEGIEDEADLEVLRDMGVAYGQGYLLGRPQPRPSRVLPDGVDRLLRARKIAVFPEMRDASRNNLTVAGLVLEVPTVTPATSTRELVEVFHSLGKVHAVAVVEDGRPVGVINHQSFLDQYSRPYQREVFARRSCTHFMNDSPILVEHDTPVDSLVEVLRGEDQRYLLDGLIVVKNGLYFGLTTGERMVRAVTELRVEAARHANPLTSLPGNIPISRHADRLLARHTHFVVAYCDLNHFKPFNDVYGYWKGDEMIRLAASIIVANSDPLRDFVGHVGGDDFILLMQSDNWQSRCQNILREFNRRAMDLFDEDARTRGGIAAEDRQGNPSFFPLTTMCIGVVSVHPGDFKSHEELADVAASAKRSAKHSSSAMALCTKGRCQFSLAFRDAAEEASDYGLHLPLLRQDMDMEQSVPDPVGEPQGA